MILGTLPRDNIYDLWNCDDMIELRKTVLSGRKFSGLCKECNATSPRRFGLASAVAMSVFDMKTVAKMIPVLGYSRPKQY
jgi:hypothetical protein